MYALVFYYRAGRYEADGYVYNAAEEPKILITGKWNESMNYQPCDLEGEPLPGSEQKEVSLCIHHGYCIFLAADMGPWF